MPSKQKGPEAPGTPPASPAPPAPWYAGGLRFACRPGCTACCTGAPGYVWVSAEEVARLAAALALEVKEFRRRHVRATPDGESLTERPNGDCVLLTPTGCAAYAARPRQCRSFPFWSENLRNPEAWRRLARRCPGLDQGRAWTREEIDRLRE